MALQMEHATCAVVGYVEIVTPFRIAGWAMDLNVPDVAVDLALHIDGETGASFRPQFTRPALNASLGAGDHQVGLVWFDITPPPSASPAALAAGG